MLQGSLTKNHKRVQSIKGSKYVRSAIHRLLIVHKHTYAAATCPLRSFDVVTQNIVVSALHNFCSLRNGYIRATLMPGLDKCYGSPPNPDELRKRKQQRQTQGALRTAFFIKNLPIAWLLYRLEKNGKTIFVQIPKTLT